MPGVRPVVQQGVRPVGPASALSLQPGMPGAPQYMQPNPAVAGAAMYQHQRYPGTTAQMQYSQYVQHQGARPTAYAAPLTEAQQAEQKRAHEEQMERARLETERRNREAEEKRIKAQEEQQRKAEEKERMRKQAEEQRNQQKLLKEEEKRRKMQEKQEQRAQKAREKEEERERKRKEKEEEKMKKLQEKASNKGPRRKPAARGGSQRGPSADGGSIVPLPDGASAPKKRAPARPSGGVAHVVPYTPPISSQMLMYCCSCSALSGG